MTSSQQNSLKEKLNSILNSDSIVEQKSFFSFDNSNIAEQICFKFNIWSRKLFPKYYKSKDAPFHHDMDLNLVRLYLGDIKEFVNAAFKGASKTSKAKLFIAFAIANDLDHRRRYFRILAADKVNSTQIATDIYNMLVSPSVTKMYPEIFAKTVAKREETMGSFTTSTGIKVFSGTVGMSQRGAIQEDARPDFIWYEDFENRTTLRSAKKTKAIWDNMEEARTGLAKGGVGYYTCNYISEMGNVHTLVTTVSKEKYLLITPIIDDSGVLAWPDRYTLADVQYFKETDDDFEGERLCKPSAAKDIIFDRETLDNMRVSIPVKEIANFKFFKEYDPSHRYGSGHDVAGGVGLDSSTSVFIDFDVIPAKVVATFKSNTIKPDTFGDEIYREGEYFSLPITGIEKNNHGHATIARSKQLGVNLYKTQRDETKVDSTRPVEYGWHTNALTKPKMINGLVKAVNDGLIDLSDPELIAECKTYTRNDLIDNEVDPRLTTRHFDLLIAAAIAWQMNPFAEVSKPKFDDFVDDYQPMYSEIGI